MTAAELIAQSSAAERECRAYLLRLEAEGYRQEAPGVWVLRDSEGRPMAMVDL